MPARSPSGRGMRADGARRAIPRLAHNPGPRPALPAGQARTSASVLEWPDAAETIAAPEREGRRTRRGAARRIPRKHIVPLVAVGVAVAAAGAAGVIVTHPGLLRASGPAHTIAAPSTLLGYTQAPALAQGMGAPALRADIVRKGNGEASHVVDAVYEDNPQTGSKSNPLIILFIGGNLSGSASSFISSFTGMVPGAFVTSGGSMGGQAACVPGSAGRPAECAWADDDTFGLFASPTLSASALGAEMRSMRPLVEHLRKG